MLRIFKFRAWDIHKKEMLYWRLFDSSQWHGIPAQRLRPMQYTGLKDKNGKEIYEGDIVRWWFRSTNPYDIVSEIVFKDGVFGISAFETQHGILNRGAGHLIEIEEVLGNIYENPELLDTPETIHVGDEDKTDLVVISDNKGGTEEEEATPF